MHKKGIYLSNDVHIRVAQWIANLCWSNQSVQGLVGDLQDNGFCQINKLGGDVCINASRNQVCAVYGDYFPIRWIRQACVYFNILQFEIWRSTFCRANRITEAINCVSLVPRHQLRSAPLTSVPVHKYHTGHSLKPWHVIVSPYASHLVWTNMAPKLIDI